MGESNLERFDVCLKLLEGYPSPVGFFDVSGAAHYVNKAWLRMFGESGSEPFAWLSRVIAEEVDHTRHTFESAFAHGSNEEIEFSVHDTEGSIRVMSCTVSGVRYDDVGPELFKAVFCRDVTERYRREQRLSFMAGHDPLTGLANRRAFEEELSRAISRAKRGTPSVVMMLDMDHLKRYNDARGHLAGDQALVNLAMLFRTHVRAEDLPARLGGDEFAVLLHDTDMDEAVEIAERMGAAVHEGDFIDGAREHELGISGGLASVEPECDARMLMDRADAALYAAKAAGRDRMIVWTRSLGNLAASERFGDLIRSALAGDGLSLVFQPVVRLEDGKVAYYESFARLTGPDGQVYRPADFIPVAERLGLMSKVTERVIHLVVEALAANPGVSVSVNLSGADLADAELVSNLRSQLEATDVTADRFVFEMTEAAVLANLPVARRLMDRLERLGAPIVLDEFGTALGAFALLRDLPAQQVKLARPAVSAATDSKQMHAFVRSVRELIESQGKTAVAAFVESDSVLTWVKNAGFSFGQGYRIHEPVGDLGELVAEMERISASRGFLG